MRPKILLRVASLIMLLHLAGHSMGHSPGSMRQIQLSAWLLLEWSRSILILWESQSH